MPSLNRVMFMGHFTGDPKLSYLPSQTAVCDFGIAINRKFKKKDGSQGEEVCFINCQIFGKRAEVVNKHLSRGDPIFVEGRMKLSRWETEAGEKRSRLYMIVENFEFVGGNRNNSGSNDAPPPDNVDDDLPF